MKEVNRIALTGFIQELHKRGRSIEALAEACRWGFIDEVKRLIDEVIDVNGRNSQQLTPIMYVGENLKILQILLDHHADVNATDEKGRTALIWLMAGLGKETEVKKVVELLLKAGADVSARMDDGSTAYDCGKGKYSDQLLDLLKPVA